MKPQTITHSASQRVRRHNRMDHDDPELRERVREELLYKPKPPEGITPGQVAALRRLFRRGQSVRSLSLRFGFPEDAIRFALTAEAA